MLVSLRKAKRRHWRHASGSDLGPIEVIQIIAGEVVSPERTLVSSQGRESLGSDCTISLEAATRRQPVAPPGLHNGKHLVFQELTLLAIDYRRLAAETRYALWHQA